MAQVRWTKKADYWRRYILVYGYVTFGESSSIRMDSTFRKYEAFLASNPYIGHLEKLLEHRTDKIFRSILIHRHYKLIYTLDIENDGTVTSVIIVDIWDTRMSPGKLISRIR